MRPVAKTAGIIPAAAMLGAWALIAAAGVAILGAPVALADQVVAGSSIASEGEDPADPRESLRRQKSYREFVWRKKVTSSSRTTTTLSTAIIEASPATNHYGASASPADGVVARIEDGLEDDNEHIRKLGKEGKTTKGQSSPKGTTSASGEKKKKKKRNRKKKKSAQSQSKTSEQDDTAAADDEMLQIEHYPAQSLNFLKNKIDESMFTWINKDEIKAGAVTCGFLTPPLGSLPEEPYPSIKVYFCMRFALKQPAAKGYMFTHCGGPGTLSDCTVYDDMGENNLRDYNVITTDQRGLGRSWPSFAHEECTYGMVETEFELPDGTPVRTQDPSKTYGFTADPTNEDSIRDFLFNQKTRMASCWTCDSCDFNLGATDGSKVYHFLDYSGTQQAIEDLDRFREAIGAEKISLWGVSYGTGIASSYATASPSTVDKLVLDSNVAPLPDSQHMGHATAKALNSRMAYLVYSCSAANALNPGTCPVDDLGLCMNQFSDLWPDVAAMLGAPNAGFSIAYSVMMTIVVVEQDWNALQEICAAADASDVDGLAEALGNAYDDILAIAGGSTRSIRNIESQPTHSSDVYDRPDYAMIMGLDGMSAPSTIPQTLILGQSWSGGAYDDDFFISQAQKVDEEYPAYGTHAPANAFMYWYGHNFYWPKTKPTSPAGSPFLTGIVAGSLFDPNTPYQLTQEMKQAFPTTHLITSQWIRHGLYDATVQIGGEEEEWKCIRYIQEYLEYGFVTVPDGFVCGAPLPGPIDLGRL